MEKFNIIKMFDNKYIHGYSEILADRMCIYLDKKGIEKVKLQYGLEILLLNIPKLILVLGISLILGVLLQTLLTLASFNILRLKAFGAHAKNASSCFVSSVIVFIPIVYVANKIYINNTFVLVFFSILSILVYMYAPADTEKRPIIGEKVRKRLKQHAVITILFLMLIAFIIPNDNLKTLIALGALIEVVTILPVTYKILKKRRNNYEHYEKDFKECNC